jgi:hypothetical protein
MVISQGLYPPENISYGLFIIKVLGHTHTLPVEKDRTRPIEVVMPNHPTM